jgi:hypothetical protein
MNKVSDPLLSNWLDGNGASALLHEELGREMGWELEGGSPG